MNRIDIKKQDALEFLIDVPDKSVDLVLIDPPYATSRETGMNKWVDHVEKADQQIKMDDSGEFKVSEEYVFEAEIVISPSGEDIIKSERDVLEKLLKKRKEKWPTLKTKEGWNDWFDKNKKENTPNRKKVLKENYIKYGSIYGKKYAVKTDYGSWDSEFTLEKLEHCVKHFYRVLKDGGTYIIFFDIWKISQLKDLLDNNKFKQIRLIEWIKTNPQPLNSSRNYLTNCREIALLGIKKGSGTFNSKYDNGIYKHPIQGGKDRFHPTQKSLKLFEDLILKHSNENDTVLDCFLGSGTTAIAALNTKRNFIGCEIDNGYYNKMVERVEGYKNE